MNKDKKTLPPLLTDAEAEAFVENADLSEYDLSGFKPMRFEFAKKEARLEMRIAQDQLDALKAAAKKQGIPPSRLARILIEQGIQSLRPQ